MCGIAGIIGELPQRSRAVSRMAESMRPRGPDASGTYEDDGACLGHCRLKIIDLSSSGDQPLCNEDGKVWVVFNGEIYNFLSLRQELEGCGHRFKSRCDTEVIVHAYEQWGEGCVFRFSGIFSFGVWDKEKRQLLLARDRLGVKPLYYFQQGNTLLFSSQVRSLLASGVPAREVCGQALSSYLTWGGVQDPYTLVEGVKALMPGTYMVFREGEAAVSRYWDMRTFLTPALSRPAEAFIQDTKVLLDNAVRSQLVSDVPLGVFLSGGIDSSSLVSIASQHSVKLVTVSLAFQEPGLDEREYSRMVAQHFGTEHREIVMQGSELLGSLPEAIGAMDQPTFDGINTYFVSKAAKLAGLTVALSGLGGDEVFCGYPTFRRMPKALRNLAMWRALPPALRRITAAGMVRFIRGVQREKMRDLLERGDDPGQIYEWMRCLFTPAQKKELCGRELPAVPAEGLRHCRADLANQVSYFELSHYLPDILLRDTDCMSMAHSLEVRVPFLDQDLVQSLFSVPASEKIRRGVNKPLLLASLPRQLPAKAAYRRKQGFALPFSAWMKEELRGEMEGAFAGGGEFIPGYIGKGAAGAAWAGFLAGNTYWQKPWALYVLKQWLERHMR